MHGIDKKAGVGRESLSPLGLEFKRAWIDTGGSPEFHPLRFWADTPKDGITERAWLTKRNRKTRKP
jgi:hypothetical protein